MKFKFCLNLLLLFLCATCYAQKASGEKTTMPVLLDKQKELQQQMAPLDSILEIAVKNSPAVKFQSDLIESAKSQLEFTPKLWTNNIVGFVNYSAGNAVGGFDKEMELRLLRKRIKFGYAEDALVYDEKTTQQSTLANQRRRWLSAQLHYMQRYLGDGFVQLLKGNFDFFDKVMQTLLLLRIFLLGVTPLAFALSFLAGPSLSPVYWLIVWLTTYVSILLAVPAKYFNKQLYKAIYSLPAAFFTMFKLFFKLKNANQAFIHTPHGVVK